MDGLVAQLLSGELLERDVAALDLSEESLVVWSTGTAANPGTANNSIAIAQRIADVVSDTPFTSG